MKVLIIFATALLTVQAIRVPYIITHSSEEEYHVLLPPNSAQGQLNLSGLGIINKPVLQAVKVKVPRYADPWLKQQLIQHFLAPHGLTLQGVGGQGPSGQSLGGKGLGVQVLGAQTVGAQNIGAQSLNVAGLGTQRQGAQVLSTQVLGTQGIDTPLRRTQGLSTQGVPTQVFSTPALGTQGIDTVVRRTQNLSTQGATRQGALTQEALTQGVTAQAPFTQALPTQVLNGQNLNQNSPYAQNSAAENLLIRTLLAQKPSNQVLGFLNVDLPNAVIQAAEQTPNTLFNIELRNRRQVVADEQEPSLDTTAVRRKRSSGATPFNNKSKKEIKKVTPVPPVPTVPQIDTRAPKISDIPRLRAHRAVNVGLVKPSVVSSTLRATPVSTTQKNCDIECTKLQYNPVCAFNGECYHEFANQCVLDAFVCRRPDLGFKATKSVECQRNWLKRCTEVELKSV